ncbi:metallophosphoesterase family protein [Desulfobulbus rhabdoformis]|uniref:metallophosphoesterase family protein n=1 Tax=Desulfobulbus rhabdoformis TaxID=34032 RepID=UPI00196520B2|nr:metallophosphoesterase family protein [Desulfobulbus rhabdoformis]MBM9613513.1 metallophosphoesterase family protein [Desulfobulbus rhabdoformis]
MKILLISDIHGNYPALAAVSEAVSKHTISYVLNCGDSLVYAPFPNQTLDWLRDNEAFTIRGNTDDRVIKLLKGKNFKKPANPEKRIMYTSTAEALSKENAAYLLEQKKKKLLRLGHSFIGLYHGSPAEHEEFLFADTPDKRFKELAKKTHCEIVITGHSHTPYHKYIGGVHFINPGSVGRMFDGNPQASFALLKIKKGNVEVKHYRCPYDIDAVIDALGKSKLPPAYGDMFRAGKKLN